MPPLSRQELDTIVLEWRDEIASSQESIRRAQDKVLLRVGPENFGYVLSVMAGILGKGAITVSNTTNTNIGNVGVAVTGGKVEGGISGVAHDNIANIVPEVYEGFARMRKAIADAPELSDEQKDEGQSAIEDLETEGKKPEAERSMGRVRNACKTLGQLTKLAKGVYAAYEWAAPHLEGLFHLGKSLLG